MTFFTSLASFCEELAPVVGPLLSTVADTSNAIDRANKRNENLLLESRALEVALLPEPVSAKPPRKRTRQRRRLPAEG